MRPRCSSKVEWNPLSMPLPKHRTSPTERVFHTPPSHVAAVRLMQAEREEFEMQKKVEKSSWPGWMLIKDERQPNFVSACASHALPLWGPVQRIDDYGGHRLKNNQKIIPQQPRSHHHTTTNLLSDRCLCGHPTPKSTHPYQSSECCSLDPLNRSCLTLAST